MKKFLLFLLVTLCFYTIKTHAQSFNEVIKAVASDRVAFDEFGYSVAISGDRAIVGAWREDQDAMGGNTQNSAGAAYIFERDGSGNWTEVAKLVASDRDTDDQFGVSVAISGDRAIVGAYLEDEDAADSNTQNIAGSAYIFERDGMGTWTEVAKIVASDRAAIDRFGQAVAISGDRVVIGAIGEDEDAMGGNTQSNAGAAYLFERDGAGNWSEVAKLVASDRASGDQFGISVSISGDQAIVGAHFEDEDAMGGNTQDDAGAAYIFERDGSGNWTEVAKLVASDRAPNDDFGDSVAISGDLAIVGAYREDEDAMGGNTQSDTGSAYIFERDGVGNWTEVAKLVASDRASSANFGFSVAISGDRVVIGAIRENGDAMGGNFQTQAGAAYIFDRNGMGNWTEIQKIVASDRALGDQFGISVSISGDQAIVGAFGEDQDAMGGNTRNGAGAAYIFEFINNNPPIAICQDFTALLDANGSVTISPSDIDNGSSDPDGDTLTYSIDNDTFTASDIGTPQTVTLTVDDGSGATDSCTATVTVLDSFITTWQTTTPNEAINIPTFSGETYNYIVDWGDDNRTIGATGDALHTYASAGTYTVKIAGTFPRIDFIANGFYKSKLLEVNRWGSQQWSSMANAFYRCDNLTITATDAPDLSNVTNVSSMFYECTSLVSGNLASWDVSSVTNMNAMFAFANQFNENINSWDVSNVIVMNTMFWNASAFNQPIDNWETSSLIGISSFLENATAFNQDLSSLDIANITNAANALNNTAISTANYDALLLGWSAQTVQPNVNFGAAGLTYGCDGQIGRDALANAPNSWTITDSGLTGGPCPDAFITTWETTGVNEDIVIPTDASETYNYTIDWGDGTTTTEAMGDATHTYATAGMYTVKITGVFPRINFDATTSNRLKIQQVNQWGDQVWSSMTGAFSGCSNLTITATDVPDLSNVTETAGMFFQCASLTNGNFGAWDVSNVTNMVAMFAFASQFNENINSWDVSNVTSMSAMFNSASLFNQPLNNWVTSSLTNASGMFATATNFNQDISNFDMSQVTEFSSMFFGATSFNQPIGSWNVSNVTDISLCLLGATAFNQDLSSWDIASVTNATDALNNTAISTANYDSLLLGWSAQTVQPNVTFGAAGLTHSCDGQVGRDVLANTPNNWTINDGGLAPGEICDDVILEANVYLQGASLNPNMGEETLMRDDLRTANLIPTTSPYTDMLTCDPIIFNTTGSNAIVDWVLVELRDGTDSTSIIDSQSALLQRDGDIVSVDGISPLAFNVVSTDYYISIKHRNHLATMSVNTIALNAATASSVNFSNGTTATFGSNAQTSSGMPMGIFGMWAGNTDSDSIIQYSGTSPDAPNILSKVLNDPGNFLNFPTFVVSGYNNEDLNMDGSTQYSGTNSDTPFILQNVLAHPGNFLNFNTYQIIEQLPQN